MLREACREAATWVGAEGDPAPAVTVNLAARHLREPALPGLVRRVLEETGLDPGRLRLEVTEHALIEETEVVIAVLGELNRLGVELEVDDFGTGYASLAYLGRLPLNAIKIDRSFVKGLGRDKRSVAIVRAVVAMSHELGIVVTAEGIETAEQLRIVRELGCDRGQGFLFARPAPAEQVPRLLAGSLLPDVRGA